MKFRDTADYAICKLQQATLIFRLERLSLGAFTNSLLVLIGSRQAVEIKFGFPDTRLARKAAGPRDSCRRGACLHHLAARGVAEF